MGELEVSVQPDKFLFDYKILIVAFLILVITIVLFCKKKTWRANLIPLFVGNIVATIEYIYVRINDTIFGYHYLFETNNNFRELKTVMIIMIVVSLVLFLYEKIVSRFKGDK